MEEHNERLTSGLSPVCHRLITGTASALRCWLLATVPTAICLCKPFSCKACPGTGGGTKPAVDPRLTRGSSPVYHRDRERSSFLAAGYCADAYLSLLTLFMQGMSGNKCCFSRTGNSIPEHALHEKVLQKRIDGMTLVSSQERRALAVPLLNR